MFLFERYEIKNNELKIYLKVDENLFKSEISMEFINKNFSKINKYIKKVILRHNIKFRGKVLILVNTTIISAMIVSCSSEQKTNIIDNNTSQTEEIIENDENEMLDDFIIEDIKEYKRMNLILISGHSGVNGDPGAVYNNRYEYLYTKELVELVTTKINKNPELNINIILENEPLNANGEMTFIKNTKAHYAISIHFNAGGGSGSEVIVPFFNDDLTIAEEFIKNVNKFAQTRSMPIYSRTNNSFMKRENNKLIGSYTDYYGVIREGSRKSLISDIIEVEFIDNEKNMLFYDNNKELYVDSIVEAITKYYLKNFVI